MGRPLGPRTPFTCGGAGKVWLVLGVVWGGAGLGWAAWGTARTAAALHRTPGPFPRFGRAWLADLITGRTAAAWPGTPTGLVLALYTGAGLLTAAAAGWAWKATAHRRRPATDPVTALAGAAGIAALTGRAAASTAIRLRPSLAGTSPRRLSPDDTGLLLGTLRRHGPRPGPAVYASWEDTILALMGPRAGKSTSLAIPFVLSAPGPVVVTSVRADVWAATAELRARRGRTWTFDPKSITSAGQTWWYNPLAGLSTVEDASRLAGHFVLTVADDKKRDLWGPAAQDLLTALFLAAAASGRTLRHVSQWLDEPGSPTPAGLLDQAGYPQIGSALRGCQNGAPETRDGIYQTARTAASALHDEHALAWVTPPERGRSLPEFDPYRFARAGDALYLLTESGSAAAPLIAAVTDRVIRAAMRAAEEDAGRIDPPVTLVLDEAANICRISDLPDLYSHLGGRGIIPVTILQSYEQGQRVWGEHGMAALWGASTKKLTGSGVDSPRFTQDLAVLTGHHDIAVRSVSLGDGRASEQLSLQQRYILEAADIRALDGEALLLAPRCQPALLRLRPWYETSLAAEIGSAKKRAETAIAAVYRQAAAGQDTPYLTLTAPGSDL